MDRLVAVLREKGKRGNGTDRKSGGGNPPADQRGGGKTPRWVRERRARSFGETQVSFQKTCGFKMTFLSFLQSSGLVVYVVYESDQVNPLHFVA